MPTSTKMFVEQSHFAMSPSVWLHISGVSVTSDVQPYQSTVQTYDYQTKHLQSPVSPPTPPLITSPTVVPCSITMIDGPYSSYNNTNKQYQKLKNTDIPKKLFIDRQIKKAKSLPGLIKGTALSRHTPLQSLTFPSPAPVNSTVNNLQDDQLPAITVNNDDSLPLPPTIEHQNQTRRPRVYFADFNKIQFIEDNNELSQQYQIPTNYTHRHRRRHRSSKKKININQINNVSPSIQQSQILQNSSHPLPRQPNHQTAQELNIKKQQLLISPRVHSSRITHLPDTLNQSVPMESSLQENSNGKYILQREKPLIRLPKPVVDIPTNSSIDISSENTRHGIARSSPIQESLNQTHLTESGESSNGLLLQGSSSISSTSTNRQRPLLRTISLRQQFVTPVKLKAIGIPPTTNNNHYQQLNNSILNARRSALLKQSISRMHDDSDDLHPTRSVLRTENRPMTGIGPIKQLKRSDVIHFNSKNSFGRNTTNDLYETNRPLNKLHVHESTQERFQNLLTVVRPPYAMNNGISSNTSSIIPNDSTIQTINHNHRTGNIRSSYSTSARGPFGFRITSDTIIV